MDRLKTVSADNIQLEIFEDFDSLAPLQAEWDALAEAADSGIFISYDWCRLWWKYYGQNRDLKIFIFWHANELVGIIPLFFETVWLGPVHIKAAKIVGTDFSISQIGLPVQAVFLPAILEKFFMQLCSGFKWDIFCIGTLAGQYRYFSVLYKNCCNLLRKKYRVRKAESGVQTYFELADSWEEYLAGLTNKQKDEFIRNYGLLTKMTGADADKIRLRTAQTENIDEIFSKFVQMHQLQWQDSGKLGHFRDWPDSEQFHKELARAQLERGRLRLLEISFKNCCLGYEYSFKYGGKYYNFLGARFVSEHFARVSIGKITFGEMAKKAISEHVSYIDSSQGKYEHKLRLGGKLFPIYRIQVIPKKVPVRIRVALFRILAKVIHIAYYRIWFCRIVPRFRIKSGPLWKSWIKSRSFA